MADDELIGRTIARYRILEKLGEGGMGIVYRAHDTRLDRPVAFKVLRTERVNDSDRRDRFGQEARTASALNHPNIVAIYDIDSADDLMYIAMEYVSGVTLDHEIARGLRLVQALKYASQIADALAAAHAVGIVHRDLKPGNVIVTDKGSVKLLDFGLAKLVEPGSASCLHTKTAQMVPVTMEGTIAGTVAYMSPEQAEGLPIDHRSDIFSFGTVLYEMLGGHRPFVGETAMSTLSSILKDEPPPIGTAAEPRPPELDHLINRCLRKERERRIQHMDDVKVAIEELLGDLKSGGGNLTAAPPTGSGVFWKTSVLWGIVILAVAGWGMWALSRNPPPGLPPVLTRLTADAGLSAFPALSPDGALVAFASDRSGRGNLDIWVQQTGRGQPIQLTTDESDDYEPTFSTDGTMIAFRSDRAGGGVYLMPSIGGAARLMGKGGHRPRFSPDGRSIAYWVGGMGAAFIEGSTDVYVVGVSGGEPRRVRPEFAAIRHPVWMPDGRVLFVGRQGPDVDWWIATPDGGPAVKTGVLPMLAARGLRPAPGDYTINPATALPDGQSILFPATLGESTNVWRLGLSLRGDVVGAAQQVTFGTMLETEPVAALRDTRAIAFSSLSVNVDIWSAPVDAAHGLVTGPSERLTEALSFEGYPDISRDGRRLAFIASRPGGWDVRLRDLQTSSETVLASGATPFLQARISADGSRIAYWQRDDTSRTVHIVGAEGDVSRKLCDDCGPHTDLSPDGSVALLEAARPPEGIWLLNTATKKQILVAASENPNAFLYGARFSPDMRWIAFHGAMGSPTARQLFVVPFRGEYAARSPGGITEADWIPASNGLTLDRDPYWAPDGTALYFLSDRDGFRCIWNQRLEPKTKRPIGVPTSVQHFHNARRSLSRADTRSSAVGVSLTSGRMFFGLGELMGNVWLATEQTMHTGK